MAAASTLSFPNYPPSVIQVGGLVASEPKAATSNAAGNGDSANISARLEQARSFSQMALVGDIEPLPIDSTETISLENLSLFDLNYVSADSVAFFRSLNEKNIDELCDIIFDECL